MKLEIETPEEKLQTANAEYVIAEGRLRTTSWALRRFDSENPVLSAELAQERALLKSKQVEALKVLREKEQVLRWVRHEAFAIKNRLGRGAELWRDK